MKRHFPIILILVLILLCTSAGCVPKKAITEEFVNCLVQTNAEAMDRVNSDLETIDKNLYATEENLVKLEQVVSPALEWIENQKVELLGEFKYGSWYRCVTPEGLAKFKNDQYEIATVELSVYDIGTPDQKFRSVLRVTDLATKITSDRETIESELKLRKSHLEELRQERLDEGHLSSSTLLSVIENMWDWEIRKINSTTYSISGPGLGMAAELTSGNWTYRRAAKQIMPSDTQSVALQQILSGE